ncbi:uncharacterized protein ISCGN_006398 [Ixodes scapularis]
MTLIPTSLPPFDLDATDPTNIGTEWRKWITRFENFLIAFDVKNDARKRSLLLHYAGERVHELCDTLPDQQSGPTSSTTPDADTPSVTTRNSYQSLKDKLDAYFNPRMNTTFEVFQFRQAKQLEGESVGQFSIRLRLLARNCGFANADEEIKNQIIFATTSSRLRRVALRQDLNLPSLLNQARLLEDVNRATTAMEGSSTTTTVQAISGQPRYGHAGTSRNAQQPRCFSSHLKYGGSAQQRTHVSPPQCFHCGAPWPHEGGQVNCPAKFASCKACGRKGHYGKVCQSAHKPIFQISHDSDSDESVYAVGTISQVSHQNLPEVHLQVNNTPITFLIDTGASVSVIGTSTLNKLGALTKLQQAGTRIYAYGSDAPLPIIGKLSVTLKYRDSDTTEDVFVIEGTVKSLLSFAAANRLGLIQITYAIQGHSQKDARSNGEVPPNLLKTPLAAFPELCAGVGKLKNLQVHLHIDKAIAPVAQPHRRIPFAVRSKVEEKISQLLALDIIEEATGPTPWVSPVVIVPKPHNPEDIRLCIDMKCANRAILRERHVCPTIDDVITALNGSTLFTKLDLKDGYHQLELDNESRTITTFATHNKLYRYKRLMFGINAAAEVFQETIRQVLNGIPHVLNISDDILVFGKTKDEHDQALQATLERLTENGLTVNPKKCLFAQKELCFFGHIFSASGIRTDPQKIAALKKMPAPANAHEVRSLLGTVNYSGRFLPNLADITYPLRLLTKKNTKWVWGPEEQGALDTLKEKLSEIPNLVFFDAQKEGNNTEIVAYASRALTPTEARYSQIERELLAVVWGTEHFHLYLYGNNFLIRTDHKPLVSILTNPRACPSARIERLMLRIQQYNFRVEHTCGINNPSDYLSRHPMPSSPADARLAHSTNAYVNFIAHHNIPKAMTRAEVAAATLNDPHMQKVIAALSNPARWNDPALREFISVQHELSLTDSGLLLKGNCLVLPAALQQQAICLAHIGHQGISKTKALMKRKVWFPHLDSMVQTTLKNCMACQATIQHQHSDPVAIPSKPNQPWEALSLDFAGPFPNGKYIMVLMDDTSRYPLVAVLSSLAAPTVITNLMKIFSTFGIPKVVKTDNGPPFQSLDFKNFADSLGFRHQRITPCWPQANGEVERFMRTLKRFLQATTLENSTWTSELSKFLMAYRATPHSTTGKTPFEVLFGRPMGYLLPDSADTNNVPQGWQHKDYENRKKHKIYADEHRHARAHNFEVGDRVLCRQPPSNKLTPPYDPQPYKVIEIKGTQVTAQRDQKIITRNSSFFKLLPTSAKLRAHNELINADDAEEENAMNTRHTHPHQEAQQHIDVGERRDLQPNEAQRSSEGPRPTPEFEQQLDVEEDERNQRFLEAPGPDLSGTARPVGTRYPPTRLRDYVCS